MKKILLKISLCMISIALIVISAYGVKYYNNNRESVNDLSKNENQNQDEYVINSENSYKLISDIDDNVVNIDNAENKLNAETKLNTQNDNKFVTNNKINDNKKITSETELVQVVEDIEINGIEGINVINNAKLEEKVKVKENQQIQSTQEIEGIQQAQEKEEIQQTQQIQEFVEKNEIINISQCSQEFMNQYFEEVKAFNAELNEKDEDEQNEIKSNMLIVFSKEDNINTYGATKTIKCPNNQYMLVFENKNEMELAKQKLNADEQILKVENNTVYEIFEIEETKTQNTTNYNSWGIQSTGLDIATKIANEKNLQEVTVAIVDTGCDIELFESNYLEKLKGTYNALGGTSMTDEVGHGTHIAGTIAEATPLNVKILPVKASNGRSLYDSDIIAGITYITDNNLADVINMSFGSFSINTAMYTAIQAANDKNIICVAAAGNESVSAKAYPASYDITMSISATSSTQQIASFSNYNDSVTFAAPGVNIASINKTLSGTSMATPHVASAVAICKSYNKNYSLQEVTDILKEYSLDLGVEGKDNYYGYGLIDLKNIEYCECNCEQCDELVCKGCVCTTCEYAPKYISEISVITPTNVLTYNYGSITNLSNILLNIKYSNGEEEQAKLLELEDCQISGYNPYLYENQTITITYKEYTTTFNINIENEYESGWEYEIKEDDTIKLKKFKSTTDMENIVLYIPEEIEGKTVTEFANNLFKEQNLLYKVIIPANIKTISENCFSNSMNLRYIETTAKELYISNSAFLDCSKLKDIKLSAQSVYVDQNVFKNCSALQTNIQNIKQIKDYAFYGCSNVKTIQLLETVTNIPNYAFAYTGINELEIPEGVETINQNAFLGCYNLKNITLPSTLTAIKENAFNDCTNLLKIEIPANVTNIANSSFIKCHSLEEITVNSENKVYDSRGYCNAIIETATNKIIVGNCSTYIPDTITTIGENAFNGRIKLYGIELPEGITTIESQAFANCKTLEMILLPQTIEAMETNICNASSKAVIYVYEDTYAEQFVIDNNMKFDYRVYMNLEGISFQGLKTTYKAFEKVNLDDVTITVKFTDGSTRTLTGNYEIQYPNNNDSFRYGDTAFTYIYNNNRSLRFGATVQPITVEKATPTYTIPTGLTLKKGQKLEELVLPEGFSWMEEIDPLQVMQEIGEAKFKVKYTPEDTHNYEIVKNIEITVIVETNKGKPLEITKVEGVTETSYIAFEKINVPNIQITVLYEGDVTEVKTEGIKIEYATENDSVRYADEYYIVKYEEDGIQMQKKVEIVVEKATPTFTAPTGLVGKRGQKLSEISLPTGFVWMNGNIIFEEIGNKTFKAKYIPVDTHNYKTIENIDVTVSVIKENQEISFKNIISKNGFLSGIKVKSVDINNKVVSSTKVKDIYNNLVLSKDLIYEVYNVSNAQLTTNDDLATGCVVKIYSKPTSTIKEFVKSFRIVIYGDTSCDGIINSADLLSIKKHLLTTKLLTNDATKEAADINHDGTINSGDLLLLKKHLLQKQIISDNKY